jgi:hypothetical protein
MRQGQPTKGDPANVKPPHWQEEFSFARGGQHVYIQLLKNNSTHGPQLLYLNTGEMTMSCIIKRLDRSGKKFKHLIPLLKQLTVEADENSESVEIANSVEIFLRPEQYKLPGLGILVLVGDNYAQVVSACEFQKDEVVDTTKSLNPWYISSVADLKSNLTSHQKKTVRKAFPETFCTYLMERTNSVLNQKLGAAFFYTLNYDKKKGFLCYTKAALLANLVPFQFVSTRYMKARRGVIERGAIKPAFKQYIQRETNAATPTFYRNINALSNLNDVHWNNFRDELGWYDETKIRRRTK